MVVIIIIIADVVSVVVVLVAIVVVIVIVIVIPDNSVIIQPAECVSCQQDTLLPGLATKTNISPCHHEHNPKTFFVQILDKVV